MSTEQPSLAEQLRALPERLLDASDVMVPCDLLTAAADRLDALEAVNTAATAMAATYAAGSNKYQRRRSRERLGDALAAALDPPAGSDG